MFFCKKILLSLGCWFLTIGYSLAQNLVPNYSLEFYTACPTTDGQIYYATPWTGPTANSTDYFNICSSAYTIPFKGMYPRTGNAMAGIWGLNGVGGNYREYLQTPLINTLTTGKCYYIEFYCNLLRGTKYAINNVGAYFSNQAFTTSLSVSSAIVLNYTPSIIKFNNPIIKDTLNWTKISGIYVANGTESYITIGNFKDDAHTDTLNTNYGNYGGAAYYIDDVSVIPTDSISMPPYAGRDTTIAFGDSVFIGQQLYGLHCNWYSNSVLLDTNISGIWVKPTITTTYVVEQTLCGNVGYDTVTVIVSPLGISKFVDNGLKIYPNPANYKLFIEQTKNENIMEINLFDIYGKEIIRRNKQSELDIINLTEGVYFIKVKTTDNIYMQKIIVQH
jgi:hypothetical protein